jgi:hypothetical protein
MLPCSLQRLATRWLANLPGRASHPLDHTTLPGRTFTLTLFVFQLHFGSQNEDCRIFVTGNLKMLLYFLPLSSSYLFNYKNLLLVFFLSY